MSLLDKLERVFGRFAIANISLYIVIGQVFVLLGHLWGERIDLQWFLFVPAWVMQGEWWRFFTFIFLPPPPGWFGYVFVAFAWYGFYLFGSALEGYWGTFRYNLFLLVGYVLTVAVAFLTPHGAVTNMFLAFSVFLAFARLNPDFVIYLFFILPVKIKWLALLSWIGMGYGMLVGGMTTRLAILASIGNFLLFFARDIALSMRHGHRTMARKAREVAEANQPRHVCYVCGKTDRSHPELDFRYCSKCAGDQCYCPEHIQNHAHVVAADDGKKA